MFKFGRMSGDPVFFLRFGVNERGRIEGAIEGPVDCSDLTAAMERFLSFTGAAIEISPHPRSYR